eukprot:6053786-Pleurochrysis_carterae.AAC.1
MKQAGRVCESGVEIHDDREWAPRVGTRAGSNCEFFPSVGTLAESSCANREESADMDRYTKLSGTRIGICRQESE